MDVLQQLTSEEMELLRSSVRIIAENATEVGCSTYEMIFEQSPYVKELFHFTKSDDEAYRQKKTVQLAQKYMQVLIAFAEGIEDPSMLEPVSTKLVEIHRRIDDVQMAAHWGVFTECTLCNIRKVLEKDEHFNDMDRLDAAIMLWRTVMRGIVRRLKVGTFSTSYYLC
ncbi:globin [Ancylostoma duodenale]|uniref:Globin n=1 Tax=Ancylostoma duodenale TaxID=51022 RepID=A0A0C2FN48_9BILA|nr:globin [Ancylostoma duodenale]